MSVDEQSADGNDRPHYYATTDESCSHVDCDGPAWFRLIAWSGWLLDGFCPWHAADWDRRGLAELDRSFHTETAQGGASV